MIEDEGKRYDRFRDRMMFPIRNARGPVIGFGGRVLDEGEPKYLNSPETPLFEKGRELYGLFQARQAIRDAGRVLVVEGYMDVVALAQFGVGYAVATLGTATTPMHVSKLLQLADEIVFCFDGDAAGRKAPGARWKPACRLPRTINRSVSCSCRTAKIRTATCGRTGRMPSSDLWPVPKYLSEFLLAELRTGANVQTAEGRSQFLAAARPLVQGSPAPSLQIAAAEGGSAAWEE